jgi:hypothetical protein
MQDFPASHEDFRAELIHNFRGEGNAFKPIRHSGESLHGLTLKRRPGSLTPYRLIADGQFLCCRARNPSNESQRRDSHQER